MDFSLKRARVCLENVATGAAAAGLRVISRVDEIVQSIDEECEVLILPRGRYLGHRHHTDTMTLQTSHCNNNNNF